MGEAVTMGEPTKDLVAPGPRTEQALAAIWRQALELDRVGVRDDFFGLGGDSIAAAQVLVAVQRAFGRSLPLADLWSGWCSPRGGGRVPLRRARAGRPGASG
jgi:acyl carrier protein